MRALFHCNAGLSFGMGHLMRCLAIAAQAHERGWDVALVGDLSESAMDHARSAVPSLTIHSTPRNAPESELDAWGKDFAPDVIHLDSYWEIPTSLTTATALLSNMQDGAFGVRAADLAIDANLGADEWFDSPDLSRAHLVGVDVAAIRTQVSSRRGARRTFTPPSRVLVVIGGTDPHSLTPRIVRALVDGATPPDVTVVSPPHLTEEIATISSPHLTVVPFVEDLPALAAEHDLVITAAGTSLWDFACMGIPMAVVCVTDNQVAGYRAIVASETVTPLGEPPHDSLETALRGLVTALADRAALDAQSAQLQKMVDGLGTWRIVSAWETLRAKAPASSSHMTDAPTLIARPAMMADAALLFEWRNDEQTREHSRSTETVAWETHTRWLAVTLNNADRRLFLVENAEGTPVGTVRWDRESANAWEVSITIAPSHRGRRLARPLLEAGEKALAPERATHVIAAIHADNVASRRLFAAADYLPQTPANDAGFTRFAKWIFPTIR